MVSPAPRLSRLASFLLLAPVLLLVLMLAPPVLAQDPAGLPPPKPLTAYPGLDPDLAKDPFPSTYRPRPTQPTAIVGATLLTGTGQKLEGATILLRNGRIEAVGAGIAVPPDMQVIDGKGRWVTPGLIDMHSHLGVYPSPGVPPHSDGNEIVDPNTAQVWAEHSVWPQDPGFERALQGGTTTLMILPGSANLFGGRSVTLKAVPGRTVQEMKFPGAPYGLKMACGENPKRVYGGKGRTPFTRMGNIAGTRRAWIDAAEYLRKWDSYRLAFARYEQQVKTQGETGAKPADPAPPPPEGQTAAKEEKGGGGSKEPPKPPDPPKRDLQLETLVGVLKGEILVQNHCYRADEMALMMDLAKEFGYRIAAFHHSTESYKISDLLRANDVCSATWSTWWGFKMESFDGVGANAALLHRAGACAVIHSDNDIITQHMNKEASRAMALGNRLGLAIRPEEAIQWITRNPAKAMGILDRTGTLEPGKMADVVLWDRDPFSVYALADLVFVDGAVLFDRRRPERLPRSDFELGQPTWESYP